MGFSCSCVTKPNQNKTPLPISKAYFLLSVHVSQQHAVLETLLESGRVTSSQGITLVNFNLMLTLKLVKKRLKHICNIQPTTWNWDLTAFYLGITYYAILQSWFIPVNPRPMFTLKRSQFLGIMTSEYRAHINPAKKKKINFLNTASTTDSILNQQIQIVDESTWIFTQTFCACDQVPYSYLLFILFTHSQNLIQHEQTLLIKL